MTQRGKSYKKNFFKTKKHELVYASYHEAGHAIYTLLKSFCINDVFISDKKRVCGLVNWISIEYSPLSKQLILDEIKILNAGLASEYIYYEKKTGNNNYPSFLKKESGDDLFVASSLIKQYNLSQPGKKRLLLKKKIFKDVLFDLNYNWDAVTLIAKALLVKRKLSYLDIQNILIKKSKNKKFWKYQFKKIDYIFNNLSILDKKDLMDILK